MIPAATFFRADSFMLYLLRANSSCGLGLYLSVIAGKRIPLAAVHDCRNKADGTVPCPGPALPYIDFCGPLAQLVRASAF